MSRHHYRAPWQNAAGYARRRENTSANVHYNISDREAVAKVKSGLSDAALIGVCAAVLTLPGMLLLGGPGSPGVRNASGAEATGAVLVGLILFGYLYAVCASFFGMVTRKSPVWLFLLFVIIPFAAYGLGQLINMWIDAASSQ